MQEVKLDWIKIDFNDRHIILYASKLAACANMHKYCDADELKEELYFKLGLNKNFKSKRDKAFDGMRQMPWKDRCAVNDMMKATYSNVQQIQDQIEKAKTLTGNADVLDFVRMAMYTKIGSKSEAGIRQNVAKEYAKKINQNAKIKISTNPWFSITVSDAEGTFHTFDVYLGGKHDGMMEDNTLVEIKTRQRGFLGVPLYENIQIHCYMTIFETHKAMLIESYMGEEKSHEIYFDDVMWTQVKRNSQLLLEECLQTYFEKQT